MVVTSVEPEFGAVVESVALLAEADAAMFCAKRRSRRLARSHPDGLTLGSVSTAAAGRLIVRMTELLADIEDPDRFDLRGVPAR